MFNQRDERLSEQELEFAVRGACGDPSCGILAVDVDIEGNTVIWSRPHWAGDDDEDGNDMEPDADDPTSFLPQMLVFNRADYDVALADTERFIARAGWHRTTPEAGLWLGRMRNRFTNLWDTVKSQSRPTQGEAGNPGCSGHLNHPLRLASNQLSTVARLV